MDGSDPVEVDLLMPPVTVMRSRINRGLEVPSFFFSGLASAISTLFIGMLLGAAGGLLLGATAVVLFQSLELLADNKQLMDQLENYILEYPFSGIMNASISQLTGHDHVLNTPVSLLVEQFDVFSSTLSLTGGVFVGLSTFALVIKRYSEAAKGKALVLAGHVCLMCVTLIGYILGSALQSFLSITSSIKFSIWLAILLILTDFVITFFFCGCRCKLMGLFKIWLLTPVVVFTVLVIIVFVTTKLALIVALIPKVWHINQLGNTYNIKLITAPVPLMLIITDVFNIAGQPIVTLQSPTSTNTTSAVPEAMLVGFLISQMLTVILGMSLFFSWEEGGAGKITGTAAGCGAAVLGAIKLALPVLGPGPTIGALTGVAGAAGVSLSAAAAKTGEYGQAADRYGLIGTLGVTLGAAAGALISSFAHSGLSGVYVGLCAATLPAGLHLKQLFTFLWKKFVFFRIIITIVVVIWLCFTGTTIFLLHCISLIGSGLVYVIIFGVILGIIIFCNYFLARLDFFVRLLCSAFS